MRNEVIAYNELGDEIKIEVLFSFKIQDNNKEYVAYTINDNDDNESAFVFLSELSENNKLISISEEDKELVADAYDNVKETILNEI